MRRAWLFCKRNVKELLKDPLGWVFSLGFPILFLVLFAVINRFLQNSFAEQMQQAAGELGAGAAESVRMQMPTMFEMKNNVPAMAFFGMSFLMLTLTILVSKDKSSAFLTRLFSSPMRTHEFIIGYFLPGFALCFAQQFVCYSAGEIIGAIEGTNVDGGANVFSYGAAMFSLLSQIPSMVTFLSLGILFGTLLGEKSAPPCTAIVINVAGIFGGCYFPLDTMGGFATVCKCLPFYPQVLVSRGIMNGIAPTFADFWGYFLITVGYAVLFFGLAVFFFFRFMRGRAK